MPPPEVDPYWIRNPSDVAAIEAGCYFDAEAGRLVCDFIETFCKQSKGRWSGEPLTLLDWQRDFLMRLFGWKLPSGLRRFRTAYLEVAKKNGKSTLFSAIALFLLIADGEGAPEIYLNACDREQAGIIYEEAARMARASTALSKRLEIIDSKKKLLFPRKNGKIVANSAEVGNKDGINASTTMFDELHRQPNRELWDIFEYAGASREQPLTLSITTAGEDHEGVWYEQREKSEQVNSGANPDWRHLGIVYRALPTDDIDDPETWRKANPSLGITIKEEDFKAELEEAKRIPAKWNNFKRLRLNIIAEGESKFVKAEVWALGSAAPRPLVGSTKLYQGLDLSSINDLSALATLYEDDEHSLNVVMRFYLPEDNIVQLEHQHGVPYRAWAQAGWIKLTPGNVIDYEFIRRDINGFASKAKLRKLLADPYKCEQLLADLKDNDGLPLEYIRQGFLSLGSPTSELLRLLMGGRIRHGDNPILKWMAANAVAETDAADNMKLSKRKSSKKIDGMAALVNAIAAWMLDGNAGPKASVYEKRGILFM